MRAKGQGTSLKLVVLTAAAALRAYRERRKKEHANREEARKLTWIAQQTVEDLCPDIEEVARLVYRPDSMPADRRNWVEAHVRIDCISCEQEFLRFAAKYDGPRK